MLTPPETSGPPDLRTSGPDTSGPPDLTPPDRDRRALADPPLLLGSVRRGSVRSAAAPRLVILGGQEDLLRDAESVCQTRGFQRVNFRLSSSE